MALDLNHDVKQYVAVFKKNEIGIYTFVNAAQVSIISHPPLSPHPTRLIVKSYNDGNHDLSIEFKNIIDSDTILNGRIKKKSEDAKFTNPSNNYSGVSVMLGKETKRKVYDELSLKLKRAPNQNELRNALFEYAVRIGECIDDITLDEKASKGKIRWSTEKDITKEIDLGEEYMRMAFTKPVDRKTQAVVGVGNPIVQTRRRPTQPQTEQTGDRQTQKVSTSETGTKSTKDVDYKSTEKIDANAIIERLKKKIKGQDKALENVVYALVSNQEIINSGMEDAIQFKTNILIDGPSGTGKTYTIESVARELGIPCVVTGITNYSATGYRGAELSDILKKLLRETDGNLEVAQKGIIALDEIDKLGFDSRKEGTNNSMHQAIQDELLTYMSGTNIDVEYNGQTYQFDTRNISFIGMGAFERMHKEKVANQEERIRGDERLSREYEVTKDDYISQGLRRELLGRFQTLTHTNELGKEQLRDILLNAENSRIKKLLKLGELKKKEIHLTGDAIDYIVNDAFKNNTGARALGDSIEKIIGVINKDLYNDSISVIDIDESIVEKSLGAQRIQYIDPDSRGGAQR